MTEERISPPPERASMLLAAETLRVSRRVRRTLVRAVRTTRLREVVVAEDLVRDEVVVERVPVGRVVDAVPPARQDGEVTILPVVVEELVLVRRLVLKEEVHLRRVRSTAPHSEVVTLREQQVSVTRTDADDDTPPHSAGADELQTTPRKGRAMNEDTIVAVYDTAEHAKTAADALRAAGVPEGAITLHAGSGDAAGGSGVTGSAARDPSFWSSVMGGAADTDAAVYDRSMGAGSTVVSVQTPAQYVERVMVILEDHHPIDIDERAAGYGLTGTATGVTGSTATTTAGSMTAPVGDLPPARVPMPQETAGLGAAQALRNAATGTAQSADTLQLSEETLAVGKRVVNRGGTRIRRYVVETPVEQNVTLHDEKVVLERRPVTDGRPVDAVGFTDKTIEMTESTEEAVVSKQARVYEEVGLRKEAKDRVETVRDTVRKEEVEVEQIPGSTSFTTTPKP